MTYDIHTFVGHYGNHFDEFALGKVVRDRGERKWGPRVPKAKWKFIGDPNMFQGRELVAAGELPLGICGWPYDEHVIPDARKKWICAVRLGYEDLGIAQDEALSVVKRAAYQSLVRYGMFADCKPGIDWQALPNLIKRRWNRWYAFQGTDAAREDKLQELIWRCELDINDFFDDTVVFWEALYAVKDNLERRKFKVGERQIDLALIPRDHPATENPQVKNAIMSRRWTAVTETPPPKILIKWDSRGNFGIFTSNASDLDLSEVVVALRPEELSQRGIAHNLTRDELLQERCEICPWIHWMEGSQTILNGSKDSAREVEAARTPPAKVISIVEEKTRFKPKLITPVTENHPDQIELSGPVKAALLELPGPTEEIVILEPGEDGVIHPKFV